MQPDGSTCIRVVFGSGGVALGWSTENMISPESEMKTHMTSSCGTPLDQHDHTIVKTVFPILT